MELDQIMSYNLDKMDDNKPIFTPPIETKLPNETFGTPDNANFLKSEGSRFSPLATPFQSQINNEMLNLMNQQEPNVPETPQSASEIEDLLLNNCANASVRPDLNIFDELGQNLNNCYIGGNRPESGSTANANLFPDGNTGPGRNGDIVDIFDFLIKSLSSANYYVSMLTREQLAVLRSVRPGLLYEFLLEIAKVRSDKFLRRALPNECAFCKNNGENEEYYSSHVLKDWRGRVLCPVLRAFRCPRCGATGDRAHTIKYCPENTETGIERSGSLLSRRRMQSGSPLTLGGASRSMAPPIATPVSSPSPASAGLNQANNWWSNFGIN